MMKLEQKRSDDIVVGEQIHTEYGIQTVKKVATSKNGNIIHLKLHGMKIDTPAHFMQNVVVKEPLTEIAL